MCVYFSTHSGLTVYLYRAGEDRLQYKGTKSTEGLSKFLIKNLGDAIVPNLLEVPEKLDALNELDSETFADHVAIGNHLVISETDYLIFRTKRLTFFCICPGEILCTMVWPLSGIYRRFKQM